ncbi:MAG: response regulator [Xenococcaceae cyanobacterium]
MHLKFQKSFENQSKSGQPLVLIVDDNRDNLLLASCVIESMGMHYVVTDDSEECLNLVNRLSPNLILLDIVMPRVDGFKIASTIKQNPNLSNIQLVAVTGLASSKDKQKIMEEGFDDYLCKPYLIEELESKVLNCLNYDLV